jgi:RHS repeat-associated protein
MTLFWGKVRYDGGTGSSGQILNPDHRYCGSLGHKYDSMNGLVYMRARYYEAETGRFISEDPANDGANWYSYGSNIPTKYVDASGKDASAVFGAFLAGIVAMLVTYAKTGGEASLSQMLGAFFIGVSGNLCARLGGRVTEALSDGSNAWLGAYLTGMSVGGFTRAVATMFIDMMTGTDFDGGDLALACFQGAVGSAASYGLSGTADSWAKSTSLGLFVGSVGGLLHKAGNGH